MDRLRPVWLAVMVGIMTLGYLGSVSSTLRGEATDWAAKIDRPPIAMLALALALAGIALGVTRRKT